MKTKKMKRQRLIDTLIGCLLFCGLGVASADPVKWADNGHYYQVVENAPRMSWEDARDWAYELRYTDDTGQLFQGTITSSSEAVHIKGLTFTQSAYLLGGYQIPTTNEDTLVEKKSDWHWITDEEWGFTNWGSSEPNNFFRWVGVTGAGRSEEYLQYIPGSNSGPWNDVYTGTFIDNDGEQFFGSSNLIVEYEPASEPDPGIEDPNELLLVTLEGKDVTADWSLMPEANSYTLYYAYADYKGDADLDTLGAMEMGQATSIYAPNLPSGAILYIAILAHTDQGDILSNIVRFMPFGGSVTYPEGADNVLMQLDDPGGIGNFTVSGSVNGDTVHITQISGNDGSGPFVLTVVDDKPVTYVAADLTINFTSLADGSVVVQRVQPRAAASAQDVLDCEGRLNRLITLSRNWYEAEYIALNKITHFLFQMGINQDFMNPDPVHSRALFLMSLFAGARADLVVKFNAEQGRLEQEYEECSSDPTPEPDEPANSCRLLYDPSLDEDGNYIIWINNEDNGFQCLYHSVDPWRLARETPYLNGERDGLVLAYYEVGTLLGEVRWLNGEQHGISRRYWPNGNVWYETPMSHSEQDGLQKIYYESGILFKEIPWYQGDDFVDGVFKSYGENGNLNYETTYDENGKETGIRNQYYESGQLKSFITLVSNRANGEFKSFYESGQLQRETSYVDSKYHGTLKDFREDGTLRRCRIYAHGSDEGSCMP